MLRRGFAILGLLAVSPAHASLIEYSFTSTIAGYGVVPEDFGVEVGGGMVSATDDEGWSADGRAVNAYLVNGIQVLSQEWFCGSLSSEFQVPKGGWGYGGVNPGLGSPTSVPEPATLSLLAAGALGAFAARRRKQAADAK